MFYNFDLLKVKLLVSSLGSMIAIFVFSWLLYGIKLTLWDMLFDILAVEMSSKLMNCSCNSSISTYEMT